MPEELELIEETVVTPELPATTGDTNPAITPASGTEHDEAKANQEEANKKAAQ